MNARRIDIILVMIIIIFAPSLKATDSDSETMATKQIT